MNADLVILNGAAGEGGGQIVRTALCLSLVTGRAVRVDDVRARRSRPGLLRQHLTAVELAAQVGRATVSGAELGSTTLEFRPQAVRAGRFARSIGTAGSTTLVAQTVLPALLGAEGASELRLEGGTHNPLSPPFDFFDRCFLGVLRRMGAHVDAELVRHGFYPAGGGEIRVSIRPSQLRGIELLERGVVGRVSARACVADLPLSIAERELDVIGRKLELDANDMRADQVAGGPGNFVAVDVETDALTAVFTSLGRLRVPAERVAANAVREVRNWLRAGVPVDAQLADQLLLPMALAGGGAFRTVPPTSHARTNARVIEAFLPETRIEFVEDHGGVWRVMVGSDG